MPAVLTAPDVFEIDGTAISIYAQKLIKYSRAFHQERPQESKQTCVEVGLGQLGTEYNFSTHIAHSALAEIAALKMFED